MSKETKHIIAMSKDTDNMSAPAGEKFAWDVFKKYTRGQMQDATESMLEDLKKYLDEKKEEKINI